MEVLNDLNTIQETLAKSKSIVKESLDLTKKNANRKKESEKRLNNCFNYIESKNYESSFTLDLENPQISVINKEKSDFSNRSFVENKLQRLYAQVETLEKEKSRSQQKFEELQDFIRELEESNLKLKSKLKVLIGQIKLSETGKADFQEEIEELQKKNKILNEKYDKIVLENKNFSQENVTL